MIEKCKGLILNKIHYSNTSLIINFYTTKFGKLTALVKGANRKNKYNSNFDLFTLNELILYKNQNNGLSIVSECNLLNSYSNIKKDISKTSYGLYFIDLLNMASEPYDANLDLYKLCLLGFDLISIWSNLNKVKYLFETRLLYFSGLMPRIDSCVNCGMKIKQAAYFSYTMGGLLCNNCKSKDKSTKELLKGTVIVINKLLQEDLKFIERTEFSKDVCLQLENVLSQFLVYQFGRKAKSLNFLNLIKEDQNSEFLYEIKQKAIV